MHFFGKIRPECDFFFSFRDHEVLMARFLFAAIFAALFTTNIFAHQAFTLISSEKKTVTEAELVQMEKTATNGATDKTNLTFTGDNIQIVVTSGPEDDMLSYRIQGMRNPTILLSSGATVTVWFVNMDGDMQHDIRFGDVIGDFSAVPDLAETAGTEKLAAHEEKAPMQAEKIVIKANEDGAYKYFCSVRGHAKGGMWGNVLVGVKPGAGMKMPVKQPHVHTPEENKMESMPGMKKPDTNTANTPGMKKDDMSDMPGMEAGQRKMSSASNIGDPMERESSGTAWVPDSSPMYAKVKMNEDGSMWMLMGMAFIRYTQTGSMRDVSIAGKGSRSRFDAPSMFMAMYSHPISKDSQFGFRAMLSLDPLIERGYGYPLLYQSGEQFRGQPIHDRQHPHDLFSELAVTFSHRFNEKKSFYLYAGYPAEPALGPPMYLHRPSGMNIPDAPLGHHWQDSTHVSFGIVTAGFSFGKAKIEASTFNGTEPDENRWNFDKPRLNSFSGRFSFNPTKDWSFQVSHGYLKNPERSEPEIRILRRTTASAIYNKQFNEQRDFAGAFIWGQNYANGERTNSILFEGNYNFFRNAVFGRLETIQKSGHDLVLAPILDHDIFRLNALSLGYIRDLIKDKGIDVGLGGMFTASFNPMALTPYYGGTAHGGWQIFLRLRPSRMTH